MISRRTIDRLTITTLALAATMPFLAVSPVQAATVDCTAQATQLRTEVASANPQDSAKALRSIKIAEKLCAAGNSHEAGKKFKLARTQLATNVQLADRR